MDVILTDINMPKMNGEELLKRLEREGALQSVPTLVISTDATSDRILRMLALGARRVYDQTVFAGELCARSWSES